MLPLPTWLADLQQQLPGESDGAHIARIFKALNKISFDHENQKLIELFYINEPDHAHAFQSSRCQTNCGTTTRCVWAVKKVNSSWVTRPYVDGMVISWLLNVGKEKNAYITPDMHPAIWTLVDEGWCMHYQQPGTNNHHVETALSTADPDTGVALHIGGGRPRNLISIEKSDIRTSYSRPLVGVFRPDLLMRDLSLLSRVRTRQVGPRMRYRLRLSAQRLAVLRLSRTRPC